MTRISFGKILIFLLFPIIAFSQSTDNEELKKMYEHDQKSRMLAEIDWNQLSNDSIREKRVYEFINSGLIITGRDYYHAAMIFQHGKDSVAYGMAVNHMRQAIALDSTINRWLLAAAIDRELMSRKKPQIYGTQYVRWGQNAKWELYTIDTSQVTDEERTNYYVESLAAQKIKARNMNLLSISDYYAASNSLDKTVDLILAEKSKGNTATYNISEEAINSFARELLNAQKLEDALAIFKLNTTLYPDGYITFDNLGGCLLILKREEEGINAYKRSLELNPKHENARRILHELNQNKKGN
ncbi:MAG: hypothetical protein Q7J34_10620 [Bacteroidales bacterium]|jgi:tetratricopeptide (TPR) repeat protein|nr:hypothetical protein [Bacteroidales bacterium]